MPLFEATIAGSLPKPSWLAEPDQLWAPWKHVGAELASDKRDATPEPDHADGSESSVRQSDELAQPCFVEDSDVLLLRDDHACFLKARKQTAYRFQLEPEVTADLLAGHPQHEFGPGVAALQVSRGQIEQERCKLFLGAQRAQQHHRMLLTDHLLAQQPVEVVL